jgi:tRNA-2-methylthio-N6-dimethylallyladenosine synthase
MAGEQDYQWHWADVLVTSATALSCQGELVRDLGRRLEKSSSPQ